MFGICAHVLTVVCLKYMNSTFMATVWNMYRLLLYNCMKWVQTFKLLSGICAGPYIAAWKALKLLPKICPDFVSLPEIYAGIEAMKICPDVFRLPEIYVYRHWSHEDMFRRFICRRWSHEDMFRHFILPETCADAYVVAWNMCRILYLCVFSSPEPKAHRWAYRLLTVRRQSVVRR